MGPENAPPGRPEELPGERRLESWKEIAEYLRRDMRTVQRWERLEGLPVHRLTHSKRGSIYAYPSELDEWRKQRDLNGSPRASLPDEPNRATEPAASAEPEAADARRATAGARMKSAMMVLGGLIAALVAVRLFVLPRADMRAHSSSNVAASKPLAPPVDRTCAAPPALIHAWLAENGGADSVGSANAVLQPGVQIVNGVMGKAFSLDGREAGLATSVQRLPVQFTLMCWVRFHRLAHGPEVNIGMTPLGDMSIVDKMGLGSVSNAAGWRLLKQEDNRFWFCLGGGTQNRCFDRRFTLFSRTHARLDTWYFLAVEKQERLVRLFVNGELEDDRPLPRYTDSEAPLLLGWNAKSGAHLNGEIADVMLFSRPYGESVINEIYSAQAEGRCSAAAMIAH